MKGIQIKEIVALGMAFGFNENGVFCVARVSLQLTPNHIRNGVVKWERVISVPAKDELEAFNILLNK